MRKLLAALGVAAVGLGLSGCSNASSVSTTAISTTTSRLPPATTTTSTRRESPFTAGNQTATQLMDAALRHGGSRSSLHYVSTSVEDGLTTTIVGDVNQISGTQTIVVSSAGARASMVIELIGHEAYFRGAAAAIEVLINLSAAQSAAAAGRWVSVVPADSVYQSTAAALTVSSVMSELALSPPVTGARNVVSGGRQLVEIFGAWTGEGITANEHATGDLEVTKGDTSLPVRFSGVVPKSAKTDRFTDNLAVSKWGETVHVARPPVSVPLSTILKSTTTTQPVVV
ncbi:MAG: hypothetical protein ACLP36_14350 [Acidimicrobiales bacterium]